MYNQENQEIIARLEKLAFKKTTPFCYSCYCRAPENRCKLCGSDDLAREMPGEGLEWGVEWTFPALLRDKLTPVDVSESFEESVRSCYPETTTIGWLQTDTVTALKELDPTSWRIAEGEYIDSELSDGNIITVDNGDTYYWTHEVENFLGEAESEEGAA